MLITPARRDMQHKSTRAGGTMKTRPFCYGKLTNEEGVSGGGEGID